MLYTEKPYTNILKGSLSDAKLKYLNIRNYFENKDEKKQYFIRKEHLESNFQSDKYFQ